ncbi:hypothetical protein BLOT_001612 [Blomia tropicalis]|nr:hypothetical protein BLOT_001612 [Blomia tropicalis]
MKSILLIFILGYAIIYAECFNDTNLPTEESSTQIEQSNEPDSESNQMEYEDDQPGIELPDNDQSESSNIESLRNQTDLSSSFAHLIKNHRLYPQLEKFKNDPNLLNRLPQNMVGNLLRNSSNNEVKLNSKQDSPFNYNINDLKQYYDQIKTQESTEANQKESSVSNQNHFNGNYFAPGSDWRPISNLPEQRLIPLTESNHVPSWRLATYVPGDSGDTEMPTSLANFYVDAEHRLMHAYETQNKDQKEMVKEPNPNLTIKDLISTKDADKGEKSATVAHKQPSYVTVEDDKYPELLSCCEQLFKNYGNKDYINEDIYLVPRGELMHKYPMVHGPRSGPFKPVSYLRGYPIIEHDGKLIEPLPHGMLRGMPPPPPPIRHMSIPCTEEHHPPHFIAPYHMAGHHQRPIFHYPPHALLLKKKLALIGKKYLLG